MRLFVVTHKITKVKNSGIYTPIFVGKAKNPNLTLPKGYLMDNKKDNISYKNNSYCELTAIYWIWKNITEDIVGWTDTLPVEEGKKDYRLSVTDSSGNTGYLIVTIDFQRVRN